MKDQLISIAEANKAKSIVEKLKNLDKEEYKTSVAFLGEFSSGKTTLVNALLKKQFLPSFDKPTTAIITEITKSDRDHYSVAETTNGSTSIKEIEVSELAEEVQKEGNNRILKVEVQNSDLLDDNTILIDTPGVSSINEMHSKVTYGYLPYMDVVFMVVNINMGSISKSLQSFIEGCPENIKGKLHFVLNFKDTKSPNQIEKLVSEFRNSLEEFISEPKLFVVSSKTAIKANTLNDIELFKKSGVKKIEEVIKVEIPKIHDAIAEARYFEALEKYREDLIFFLQEKERNLKLDKSDFLMKIEQLKSDKLKLKKESDAIFRDFDELKNKTEYAVQNLNKDFVPSFINGLNNDSLDEVLAQYTNEFTTVLEREIDSIENYNLPPYILDKLSSSTVNSINNKVGTIFQIANKLPSLVNAAAIAAATGGAGLVANAAEMAVVHAGGKAIELAEKHLPENSTKEEVSKLITEGQEIAVQSIPKKAKVVKPISKRRAVATTVLSVLDQLNVTEFAKNKITEATQKNNVYRALRENSAHIVNDIFSGINTIIAQKIDSDINNPIEIKEAAIEEVKSELFESSQEIETAKNKISEDLITLYKIAN